VDEKKQLHPQFLVINAVFQGEEIENNTWVRRNTRFISSVEHDISQVSAANE
jgi:hypothetical protein